MAKYTIKANCGHEFETQLYGPNKDRERKIEWYERDGLCPECYAAQKQEARDEENAKAAENAQVQGLPELDGSEKQIAWATTIRDKMLAGMSARLDVFRAAPPAPGKEEMCETLIARGQEYIDEQMTETSAKAWIENRDKSGEAMLETKIREIAAEIRG